MPSTGGAAAAGLRDLLEWVRSRRQNLVDRITLDKTDLAQKKYEAKISVLQGECDEMDLGYRQRKSEMETRNRRLGEDIKENKTRLTAEKHELRDQYQKELSYLKNYVEQLLEAKRKMGRDDVRPTATDRGNSSSTKMRMKLQSLRIDVMNLAFANRESESEMEEQLRELTLGFQGELAECDRELQARKEELVTMDKDLTDEVQGMKEDVMEKIGVVGSLKREKDRLSGDIRQCTERLAVLVDKETDLRAKQQGAVEAFRSECDSKMDTARQENRERLASLQDQLESKRSHLEVLEEEAVKINDQCTELLEERLERLPEDDLDEGGSDSSSEDGVSELDSASDVASVIELMDARKVNSRLEKQLLALQSQQIPETKEDSSCLELESELSLIMENKEPSERAEGPLVDLNVTDNNPVGAQRRMDDGGASRQSVIGSGEMLTVDASKVRDALEVERLRRDIELRKKIRESEIQGLQRELNELEKECEDEETKFALERVQRARYIAVLQDDLSGQQEKLPFNRLSSHDVLPWTADTIQEKPRSLPIPKARKLVRNMELFTFPEEDQPSTRSDERWSEIGKRLNQIKSRRKAYDS